MAKRTLIYCERCNATCTGVQYSCIQPFRCINCGRVGQAGGFGFWLLRPFVVTAIMLVGLFILTHGRFP